MSSNNRKDFVGPILLAIFAYLASMLTRAFQRSIEQSAILQTMKREISLNHTVTDDFVRDEKILKTLQDPAVWEDCNKANLRWWDGKSKPANIWEELAKTIWEDRYEFQVAAGFEYWCNVIRDQKNLPWHIDKGEELKRLLGFILEFSIDGKRYNSNVSLSKSNILWHSDEAEYELNDNLITPLMGAVYYGMDHHFDQGTGMLHLVDADVNDNPHDFEYERRNEVLEIHPEFNRMVMFNVSKWHRGMFSEWSSCLLLLLF